jgi:DNA mismatch repair protein MutS
VLEALESQSRADDAQIDLFADSSPVADLSQTSEPAAAQPAPDPALQAVADALQALRPDELSPREALDLIYRWRETLAAGASGG